MCTLNVVILIQITHFCFWSHKKSYFYLFLISNFRRVLNVVRFLLGNPPASDTGGLHRRKHTFILFIKVYPLFGYTVNWLLWYYEHIYDNESWKSGSFELQASSTGTQQNFAGNMNLQNVVNSTWHNIKEEENLQQHQQQNLTSCKSRNYIHAFLFESQKADPGTRTVYFCKLELLYSCALVPKN
jgi:hypothetical protein